MDRLEAYVHGFCFHYPSGVTVHPQLACGSADYDNSRDVRAVCFGCHQYTLPVVVQLPSLPMRSARLQEYRTRFAVGQKTLEKSRPHISYNPLKNNRQVQLILR